MKGLGLDPWPLDTLRYSADQPRIPAGQTGGGEWTGGGNSDSPEGIDMGEDDMVLVAEGVASGPDGSMEPGQAWKRQPNSAFRDYIANQEFPGVDKQPDFGYRAKHVDAGGVALGRYQFRNTALEDIGLKNSDGTWRTDTEFYRQYGIKTDQDFLDNPQAQEDTMTAFMARSQEQGADLLRQHGCKSFTGVKGATITVTESGIVAAIHRAGSGAVRSYLSDWSQSGTRAQSLSDRDRQVETRLRTAQGMPYTDLSWPDSIPRFHDRK